MSDIGSRTSVGTMLLPPPVAPKPLTRRAERAKRKEAARRRRKLVMVGVLGLVVIVVLGIVASSLLLGGGGTSSSPTGGSNSQQTLTMVVAGQGEPATSGALMAQGGSSSGASIVLIPTQLLVDGPTPNAITFDTTTQLPSTDAPGFALAQTLDITMDGTWRLSPTGLARLVDALGGVNVKVDGNVVVRNSKGRQVVAIPAGTTKLNGSQAAIYATQVAVGSSNAERLVRFNTVWSAVLSKLPTTESGVAGLLGKLGGTSVSSQSTDWLASFLAAMATSSRNNDVLSQTLPVTALDVGPTSAIYTVDAAQWQKLSTSAFAGSQPPGGPNRPRVLVQNGVGTAGLVDAAARQLTGSGFAFINGGNANRFGYDKTVVVVPDGSTASMQLGQSVAKALGVPASAVQVASEGQTVADVIVVLGADYKP